MMVLAANFCKLPGFLKIFCNFLLSTWCLLIAHPGRLVAGEHVYGIVKRMLILIQYQHSVVSSSMDLICAVSFLCSNAVVNYIFCTHTAFRIATSSGESTLIFCCACADCLQVVRESALQCLGAVVRLPYTRVYPLRAEVSHLYLYSDKVCILCLRVYVMK